ncbi:hypothetical protein EV368DRAFT_89490 [Lentinula lateritia]|uniref:Uncharacterized protein n=1 Tax=Lentinula aff. lateritia TaxID=2804960 RepID=A0ACC1TYT7_9AGAR|nr:hypothetical protein F5876DRAFT_77448 [Lentinula aff. lateritia]KAJ3846148.1 hypothetical protein EV368DRAFT_89490 [Lentinula lateritia]
MVDRWQARMETDSHPSSIQSGTTNSPAVPVQSIYDLGATRLLQSLSNPNASHEQLPPLSSFTQDDQLQPPSENIDWNLLEDLQPEFSGSREEEGIQALNNFMLNIFEHGPDNINSDDEFDLEQPDESSDSEDGNNPSNNPSMRGEDAFNPYDGLLNKRPRTDFSHKSPEWFPWPNRTACTLDILMHLPRSVFSVRQSELFLWLLRVNGIQDATSVKTMKDLDAKLQGLYGIQTFEYKGAFGHTYYVNSLADIVSQEMCNPRVRPHLEFYPEDCGGRNVSEARQSSRMLNEIPDNELGPMVRLGHYDFYVFEPAKLRSGLVCMPHRWFKRNNRFHARCWKMQEIEHEHGRKSWRVIKGDGKFEVDEEQFLLPFPILATDVTLYPDLTDVTKIEDCIDMASDEPQVQPWTLTNPNLGNPWRQRANGAECLSFPIWLYCDDTSGNTSKRWNEHNSFLFAPAGLPRDQSSQEYNVHFLATSNSAPPLEMLDGIADQILDCQEHGIWAWDPVKNTRVLLLICVLALLGDNPMQSEFASHIGLRGKFFCRSCWVKGKDATADTDRVPMDLVDDDEGNSSNDGNDSETRSVRSTSTTASRGGEKKKRTKFKESLKTMVQRVKEFVKPGTPRNKEESMKNLKTQFILAQTPGATNKVKTHRTNTGLKDTFQTYFIDRLLDAGKRRRGNVDPKTVVNQLVETFPSETMSPVWRIRGLDPHADTPVEILHVVLLGFVKYLWRDVIDNQIKKNPEKKRELAARLSSFDVEGLGLDSKLAGDTLVNYAGSLTGSDFRKICQAAPFVLKDFVSNECYQTWLTLSKLVPLIWQPIIEDLDIYIPMLKEEIQQFLLHAAKWSIRWFNKPKFHILVHLPDHIRRFGPAILFATEVFESYNAVIRAKSVHSNRLAPSRDIARAFAKQNRIRHMLSGGTFLNREHLPTDEEATKCFENPTLPQHKRITQVQMYFRRGDFDKEDWITVGPSPLDVVLHSDIVSQYLGIVDKKSKAGMPGTCTLDLTVTNQRWNTLKTSRTLPDTPLFAEDQKLNGSFRSIKKLVLANYDICSNSSYVACMEPSLHAFARDGIALAQVHEILHLKRRNDPVVVADSVLIEALHTGVVASSQGMPRLSPSGQFFTVKPSTIRCTVNVQHDCVFHKCPVKEVGRVYQERKKVDKAKGMVVHQGDLRDQLLNTAQMRNANYVQRFRIKADLLPFDLVLEQSTTREWNAENKPKPSRAPAHGEASQRLPIPRYPVQSSTSQRSLDVASNSLRPLPHVRPSETVAPHPYTIPVVQSPLVRSSGSHIIQPLGRGVQDVSCIPDQSSHPTAIHSPLPASYAMNVSLPPEYRVYHPPPASYSLHYPPPHLHANVTSNLSPLHQTQPGLSAEPQGLSIARRHTMDPSNLPPLHRTQPHLHAESQGLFIARHLTRDHHGQSSLVPHSTSASLILNPLTRTSGAQPLPELSTTPAPPNDSILSGSCLRYEFDINPNGSHSHLERYP